MAENKTTDLVIVERKCFVSRPKLVEAKCQRSLENRVIERQTS